MLLEVELYCTFPLEIEFVLIRQLWGCNGKVSLSKVRVNIRGLEIVGWSTLKMRLQM